MHSMRERSAVAAMTLACASCLFGAGGCDPSEDPPVSSDGPPFLVIGRAAQQPSSADLGVNLYVQARGGNYVGFVTHGCVHTLGNFVDVTSSCTYLPSSGPLSFTVDPGDQGCSVEAHLYFVCDDAGDIQEGQSSFGFCDSQGTLITTVQVPIDRPGSVALAQEAGAGDEDAASMSGDP